MLDKVLFIIKIVIMLSRCITYKAMKSRINGKFSATILYSLTIGARLLLGRQCSAVSFGEGIPRVREPASAWPSQDGRACLTGASRSRTGRRENQGVRVYRWKTLKLNSFKRQCKTKSKATT